MFLESVSQEGIEEMNLVVKYFALIVAVLKRGLDCPQAQALVNVLESNAETVVETSLNTNLAALAAKYPGRAAEIAAATEILGHCVQHPTP